MKLKPYVVGLAVSIYLTVGALIGLFLAGPLVGNALLAQQSPSNLHVTILGVGSGLAGSAYLWIRLAPRPAGVPTRDGLVTLTTVSSVIIAALSLSLVIVALIMPLFAA